jgi:hypothetical protein
VEQKDEIGSITTTEPIAQLVMMWNLIIALLSCDDDEVVPYMQNK